MTRKGIVGILSVGAFVLVLSVAGQDAAALDGVGHYGGRNYRSDSTGLVDAINRNSGGTPAARPVVRGQVYGRQMYNPYSHEWYRDDTVALVDAINRDNGGTPAPRPIVRGQLRGRDTYNPYSYKWYRDDTTGLVDAINRDHPPTYR